VNKTFSKSIELVTPKYIEDYTTLCLLVILFFVYTFLKVPLSISLEPLVTVAMPTPSFFAISL